jgi:hypothetical protein
MLGNHNSSRAMNDEKYRRMELRKANGTREVKPIVSPSYHRGPEYLIAHACFPCRKSFKMLPLESDKAHKCPDCEGLVYEMGRSFTAPKKTDIKQWKKVYGLYVEGFRFFGSGFHNAEKLPEKLSDLKYFLQRNSEHHLRIAKPNYSVEFERNNA